ncbi:hypothetical protein F5Y17DRAFT_456166 [Xylariaceae sp. FL0594]|nr:hypothetical protein F5Y17DRAFT_456166 [Xylariaceae sp. FL0594]
MRWISLTEAASSLDNHYAALLNDQFPTNQTPEGGFVDAKIAANARINDGAKSCRPDPTAIFDNITHRHPCEDVMNALEECHARGFLWMSMGMCNDAKRQVTLCLRAERLKRTAHNREVARAKREKTKQAWAEIDENS